MVTMRLANDNLLVDLRSRFDSQSDLATTRVVSIGDCDMPGLLAEAIHSGHAAARALDTIIDRDQPFRIEQADIVSGPANCLKGSRS
jgi:dimethylamine/trimethylamine dehydrogenase